MSSTTLDAPEEDRVIWRSELKQRIMGGVCSETIRRYLKSNKLPKPDVELSRRAMGWKLSTLRAAGIDLL